jgi:myo-inositol-1(or 4)-monophosphatase
VSVPFPAEALAEIALEAAAFVRRDFAHSVPVESKPDGSPVTATDRTVDAFLREALLRLVPEAGWLSEETPDDDARLTRRLVWIVDPIDGTGQLVRRIPELAVSVGLVRRARPAAAAVVNPVTEEMGVWVEGMPPEFRNLAPRTTAGSLEGAEATVSRSEWEAGELSGFAGVVGSTRPLGSVAYKLLRVASGADHLTYSLRSKREWDVCAGIGLVEAAGRVCLRLDRRPVRFNRMRPEIPSGAVAGPEALARALRRRLRSRLGRF